MATRSFDQALRLSPKDSKTQLLALNNLVDTFGLTFEWTGETEALDIAVSRHRDLAALEISNAIEWADILTNFGNILLHAYDRYSRREFAYEALQAFSKALGKYPKDHIDVAATQSLLCSTPTEIYRDSEAEQKKEEDIQKAIEYGFLSVEEEPVAGVSRVPLRRHVLSEAFLVKWDKDGRCNDGDLTEAIHHSEMGLDATLSNDPDRAYYLVHHSNLLILKTFQDGVEDCPSSFDEPLELLKETVSLPNRLALLQVTAARKAIEILGKQGRWKEAKSLGLDAMELLPMICGRYLRLHDQQQAISHTSGFAAEICSLLLKVGEPEEALRQLEAGRAMLLWFAMDNSDEVSALAASPRHRDLANEFTDAKSKLRIPPHLQGSPLGELKLRQRWEAEAHLSGCLGKIREINGYHDFLSEPSMDRMKSCSQGGPIVVVNISYISSDAIIVNGSSIRAISLPSLQLEKAIAFGAEMISSFSLLDFPVQRAAKVLSRKVPKQLAQPSSSSFPDWLWTHCVRPIFDEINIFDVSQGERKPPRMWWIGSGAAAGFPFHAAASGSEPGRDALSLSIPSYTPSIKALLRAKERSSRSRPLANEGGGLKLDLTVITMETTPGGHADLPAAKAESSIVRKVAERRWNCANLPQPTARLALEAIAKSDVIHFACHSVADMADPSQSHLVLEKPSEKANAKDVDKLSLSQLLALERAPKAWIAFLSACSLWKVEDEIGVDVARAFYENVIDVEAHADKDIGVAAALREAVMKMRVKDPSSWSKWAAYIHSGA
ncbi:hypothetical protein Trco_007322 [Trichoderma cornu-damae]|uniref:CHAT domain-containing protein n=1 Tax=Trichoderma cornu-damae TaxID=654480 RepID=A0A9P8TRH9_9HYPO|nr:hypothetical protein Trco_007322 [Trichoderma cornu-damae]